MVLGMSKVAGGRILGPTGSVTCEQFDWVAKDDMANAAHARTRRWRANNSASSECSRICAHFGAIKISKR